ncbi:hypothetical protein HC776_00050 [bacterium]|nr:hypothetical protein [bacterium]
MLTSVYYIGQAEYKRVRQDISRATHNHLERGDVWSAGYSRLIYATTFYGEGDYDTATRLMEEILQIANEKRILQQGVFAYTWLARIRMVRGDTADAQHKIEHALTLLQEMQSNDQSVVDPWALAALIFFHNAAYGAAYEAAEKAMQLATHNKTSGQWGKHAFPAVIHVYLGLRDHVEAVPVDAATLLQKAKAALRSLHTLPDTMAKIFSYHVQGAIAYAEGKPRAAYAAWEKGVNDAHKRQMPLEEALCHQALGRALPEGHPQKQKHVQAAVDIFTRLKANLYLTEHARSVSTQGDEKIVQR